MPHAAHFLERLDRVTREQTEFALGLYRDGEAVRYVLGHVKLPPAAQRVALSIDDAREGPFVIVTLDGRFVTCLGKGMHHDLPVVPRAQLDALLAKVADKRARKEMAQRERRPDEDEDDVFQRVVSRGSRLTREDYIAVSAFEPMLGQEAWRLMLDLALEAVKMRAMLERGAARVTVIKEGTAGLLEKVDRLEWAVAHLTMLSCAGERGDLDALVERCKRVPGVPTFPCAAQGGTTFFLRSAWAVARLGREMIPMCKEAFATADDWMQILDASLCLGAIAMRHAGSVGDVRRFFGAHLPPKPDAAGADASRSTLANVLLTSLDSADEYAEKAILLGKDFCSSFSRNLSEGDAHRFEKPEDVPEDLARTMVLAFDGDIYDDKMKALVVNVLPLAARASAEDFYLPREYVRAWYGQWQPEETLERLKRFSKIAPKREPVRADKTPGRNDPCPCGSGKKYKKCHGA